MVCVSLVILFTKEVERTLLRWLQGYDCCYQVIHCTQPAVTFNYHRLCLQIPTRATVAPWESYYQRKSIRIALLLCLHVSSRDSRCSFDLHVSLCRPRKLMWPFLGVLCVPSSGACGIRVQGLPWWFKGLFLLSPVYDVHNVFVNVLLFYRRGYKSVVHFNVGSVSSYFTSHYDRSSACKWL